MNNKPTDRAPMYSVAPGIGQTRPGGRDYAACRGGSGGRRAVGQAFAGKVHALGISDNRDRVGMAALAAASLVAGQGVEPILHVTNRDRNRIRWSPRCWGLTAVGIRNILCTSGTHQTIGQFRAAKNVYDIDVIQLLQTCANLASDAGAGWRRGPGRGGSVLPSRRGIAQRRSAGAADDTDGQEGFRGPGFLDQPTGL